MYRKILQSVNYFQISTLNPCWKLLLLHLTILHVFNILKVSVRGSVCASLASYLCLWRGSSWCLLSPGVPCVMRLCKCKSALVTILMLGLLLLPVEHNFYWNLINLISVQLVSLVTTTLQFRDLTVTPRLHLLLVVLGTGPGTMEPGHVMVVYK